MSSGPLPAEEAAPAKVVAALLVRDPSALAEGLATLAEQVYELENLVVVGGGTEGQQAATAHELPWARRLADLVQAVTDEVTYVWFVNEQTRPRPDALAALVHDSERVGASVAGSKVLSRSDEDVLLSVGMSTDVFDVPYLGLEYEERDQAQYDVIRDVAAVPAISLLVRRDLLRGLQGPDAALAPEAAGIDFCQRARLRGARVVVIPSSEVTYPDRGYRGTTPWIEEAGRLRAMLKSYSLITLAWAIPLAFLVGLVEAVIAPFLGRWTLFGFVQAWLWNVFRLPSTLLARFRARRNRVVGDEELFRYQVRGSVRLRSVLAEASDRIQERIPHARVGGLAGIMEAGSAALRSPGFISATIGVGVAVLATRTIWTGRLPAVGFSLPPAESASSVLGAYAGGWNPAGLGTPYPLHPSVGVTALVQRVLFDRPELTATLLTVAALIAGVVGLARLLRGWGISAPAAYVGGVIYIAGPGAQAVGDATQWTVLLAMGALPWAIRAALRPWPHRWLGRAGRVAAIAWTTGAAAAGLPALLVVPSAVLVVWVFVGAGARWWTPIRAAVGALLAVPLLFPWFGVIALDDYVRQGEPAFWSLPWWIAAVVGAGGLAVLVVGDRLLASVGGWGALLAAGGLALARTAEFEFGRDVELTGMVLAALGTAVVAGVGVEVWSRLDVPSTFRRSGAAVAAGSSIVLVAIALVLVVPGRAGLPGDEFRDMLSFTSAQGQPEQSRVLFVGPAQALPGESRAFNGATYRVGSAPIPRLWESLLGEPRLGDSQLDQVLTSITAGEIARAGEALAPFGIRWVVVTGETPLAEAFGGQLDLVPLPGLSATVFLSEAEAVRAVASDGSLWTWDAPSYRGKAAAGATVYIAENGDRRWGPHPWRQSSWGNEVAADDGVVAFEARSGMRREATAAAGWLGFLLALSIVGTGKRGR